MYLELKLLGLRPMAKVVGFQEPCRLQSSRNGPHGTMRNQDRLTHHEGVGPYQTGSGRSVARTRGFSPLSLSCTAASLRTLFRALLPQQCHTIIGVSTHQRFVPWRLLSCCSMHRSGGQMGAKALGLPRLQTVYP